MSTLAAAAPQRYLEAQIRWRPLEATFWLATLAPFVLTPSYLVLASQIAITALFALSLDLILGYAGIVSLGHAAFFGVGAYCAGLLALHGIWITGKRIGKGLRQRLDTLRTGDGRPLAPYLRRDIERMLCHYDFVSQRLSGSGLRE